MQRSDCARHRALITEGSDDGGLQVPKDAEEELQPIALLLDCDDRMADAFVRAGYEVDRGTTGFVDARRRLPRPLYEADVIVYDMQRPARFRHRTLAGQREFSDPAAWRREWPDNVFYVDNLDELLALEGDWANDHPVVSDPDIEDETPEIELYEAASAVKAGALLICFVNRAMMPPSHAEDLCEWVLSESNAPTVRLRFSPTRDSPERCEPAQGELWHDFFKAVRSPLIVAMQVWGFVPDQRVRRLWFPLTPDEPEGRGTRADGGMRGGCHSGAPRVRGQRSGGRAAGDGDLAGAAGGGGSGRATRRRHA